MPRNLEARNFLSLLQRSPSPPPHHHSPCVQSALCPSSIASSLLLHFAPPRSPLHFRLLRSATLPCHVIPLIPFRRPYHRDPWTSTCPPPPLLLSLSLSLSLRCSASVFHRLPLPVETHALTHQPIRPCDARLYRGCTTWPLANYLSSCTARVNGGKGCEGFFFDHPGGEYR